MARDPITASGSKLFIGGVAGPDIDTKAEFEALTYVEIGLIENMGDFGDEAAIVNFAALGDGRTRVLKGARNAGSMAVVVGDDPTDVGQLALIAAEATTFNYGFKVVTPNRLLPAGTDQIEYFRGMVTSKRKSIGTNDNVIRRTFNVGVNSAIVNVAPT